MFQGLEEWSLRNDFATAPDRAVSQLFGGLPAMSCQTSVHDTGHLRNHQAGHSPTVEQRPGLNPALQGDLEPADPQLAVNLHVEHLVNTLHHQGTVAADETPLEEHGQIPRRKTAAATLAGTVRVHQR